MTAPLPINIADAVHERAIELARRELLRHWTPEKWETLKRLVNERSAEQVRRMERERNLL